MSLDISSIVSNDNKTNPNKEWYEKVRDLGNYRAPMRNCSLTCRDCKWQDYYLFYSRIGTETVTCHKCGNNNCLAEKPVK